MAAKGEREGCKTMVEIVAKWRQGPANVNMLSRPCGAQAPRPCPAHPSSTMPHIFTTCPGVLT